MGKTPEEANMQCDALIVNGTEFEELNNNWQKEETLLDWLISEKPIIFARLQPSHKLMVVDLC